VRVAIADDSGLFRESLARYLTELGLEVAVKAATTAELLAALARSPVDVAVVDVFFHGKDDGLSAARRIRANHPATGVLMLSAQTVTRQAIELLRACSDAIGYLNKDNVADIEELHAAIHRVAAGECVVDTDIVRRLLDSPRHEEGLSHLSEQELGVLTLMAQGYSNRGIAKRVCLSERRVEDYVGHIFAKLGIDSTPGGEPADRNRRVLAVLQWLRLSNGGPA